MKNTIIKRLRQIEQEHAVKICHAVESGSRAWGFASVNSDYDVRFIYKRDVTSYLALFRERDVIELPVQDDLDFHGWDLYKACHLLMKSNPSLIEWLHSPIVYLEQGELARQLRELASQSFSMKKMSYHYLHIAQSHYQKFITTQSEVGLKKYLYTIRALFCIKWLEEYQTPAPTSFWELLDGICRDIEMNDQIRHLLHLKQQSAEVDTIPAHQWWNEWIEQELERIEGEVQGYPDPRMPSDQINQLILSELGLR